MSGEETPHISIGMSVYNEDGDEIGTIRGFHEEGLVVATGEGIESLSVEHERAGHEFGEAELMWRCSECGAMGDIEEMPDSCPDCGAPKEDIYYWTED